MRKMLIILTAIMLSLSGCVEQKKDDYKMVEIGDHVSIDYIGTVNDRVFDTSIESVARENNLSVPNKKYGPIRLIVGKDQIIKGIDKGMIGMRVGESKILTVSPEDAYGLRDPKSVKVIPIMQNVSTTRTFPKILDVSMDQFDTMFGSGHKIGDNVHISDSNVDLIIKNMTASNVLLLYNITVGYEIFGLAPWKEIVTKIDENNIMTRSDAKKNDIVQLKGAAWNTTIIDTNSENITLRHNTIPDANIRTTLGQMSVHFNDTYITMDLNNKLAGETLIYNVTVISLDQK